MRFHIPGALRAFTDGAGTVEVAATGDIGAALEALGARFPGVRDRVLTERGEVRPHVNVFVAGESIRFTGGLQTPIAKDVEVHIVPAISGG